MLLFQDKPDKIFTEILRVALEAAIEIVKFKEDDKDGEYYKVVFPNASKNFSRELALYVLEDLQGYSEDSNLWKMTDYHLVLIYDALKHYCIPASENARDLGERIFSVGDYTVWEIDFEDLIACYFKDLDFLSEEELFLDLPEEVKKKLGYSKETFGVITEMKPHQKEIGLEFYEQGEFIPEDPRPSMFTKESRVYPDVSDKED